MKWLNHAARLFLIFCLLGGLVAGCGKKQDPQPPEKTIGFLAAPGNLAFTLSGNTVILTWTHAKGDRADAVAAQGFEISKAVPATCEGCPFVFKAIGMAAMPDMAFTTHVAQGQRCYFRIQAVGPHDIRSEFSKSVMVETK